MEKSTAKNKAIALKLYSENKVIAFRLLQEAKKIVDADRQFGVKTSLHLVYAALIRLIPVGYYRH